MALDPAQNVNEQLLPHIHLISTYRYPLMARVEVPDVTKWLLAAPKIAHNQASFFWTYLDSPKDGTILLTWQPLTRLGTDFASDGYVWAGGETLFQQDVGSGLILEIYYQRAGYRPGDQFALHSRRRFRLVPAKVAGANPPAQLDMSLWITHYGPIDNNERIPTAMIPFDPRQQAIINYRGQLQRAGQIVRKEFMLPDRSSWPHIPLPREARGQPMYPGAGNVRGVPQQIAYPPHPNAPIPPSKRGRHVPPGPVPQQPLMGAPPPIDLGYDDEEDTSRGDLFDHLTPREVSLDRYKQNHEWMEEVLSSVYRMDQIVPADLGLGLKGDLSSLTDGIFEAQGGDALNEEPKKPYIGHLDKRLADEFRRRVAEKIEATNAEIEKMKADHAKMVAKFKDASLIRHAEQDLRFAVQDAGPEFWRLEGRMEDGEDGLGRWGQKQAKKVDDVVAQVEAALGKHAEVVDEVRRIQDGGYQEVAPEPEPEPEPAPLPPAAVDPSAAAAAPSSAVSQQPSLAETPHSGVMVGDSDIDMGGTAAGLLDQMHTGFSSTSTPVNNFPTPQPQLSAIPSTVATPAHIAPPSPQPAQVAAAPAPQGESKSEDVTMEDADAAKGAMATTPDQGTGSGEWVVVPKGGSPSAASPNAVTAATAVPAPASAAEPAKPSTATSKPSSAAPTPADGGAFDVDNNDFSSLGDLDNGAADLENYDPPSLDETPGALGDTLDLNMDMEDSAFGDAFHGVDHSQGGDTPAEGGL